MKRTKKKDYDLYRYGRGEDGLLVNLPTVKPEPQMKLFLRLYINGVLRLTNYYNNLLEQLKYEITASKIPWSEIGAHLSMSRATIYRKVKNGKLNPFEIQAIWDFLISKGPQRKKVTIKNLDQLNDALTILKITMYGKVHNISKKPKRKV